MSETLARVMLEKKNIYPNLDFPSGPTYYLMGFDTPMFTPIFVMSRITGWCAHVMEQQANNKLIRPTATWTYVVHDNPFGSELERFFAGLAKMFRRRPKDADDRA